MPARLASKSLHKIIRVCRGTAQILSIIMFMHITCGNTWLLVFWLFRSN